MDVVFTWESSKMEKSQWLRIFQNVSNLIKEKVLSSKRSWQEWCFEGVTLYIEIEKWNFWSTRLLISCFYMNRCFKIHKIHADSIVDTDFKNFDNCQALQRLVYRLLRTQRGRKTTSQNLEIKVSLSLHCIKK